MMETIACWADQLHGLHVPLRYFNVAGAKPDGSIGEDHGPETHLSPTVLQVAQGKREKISIFEMTTRHQMAPMFDVHPTWQMPICSGVSPKWQPDLPP